MQHVGFLRDDGEHSCKGFSSTNDIVMQQILTHGQTHERSDARTHVHLHTCTCTYTDIVATMLSWQKDHDGARASFVSNICSV